MGVSLRVALGLAVLCVAVAAGILWAVPAAAQVDLTQAPLLDGQTTLLLHCDDVAAGQCSDAAGGAAGALSGARPTLGRFGGGLSLTGDAAWVDVQRPAAPGPQTGLTVDCWAKFHAQAAGEQGLELSVRNTGSDRLDAELVVSAEGFALDPAQVDVRDLGPNDTCKAALTVTPPPAGGRSYALNVTCTVGGRELRRQVFTQQARLQGDGAQSGRHSVPETRLETTMDTAWITRGFEGFARGSFGNGGQNLYVSAAGILQRVHHMDLDGDGRADWLICNSQNHWERPPSYVYSDPFTTKEPRALPSDGSISGAVADLNGDGCADLVLCMDYNGSRSDLNAFIYYGGPSGLGEHSRLEIPAPEARAVACGDFNGDGRPDLAFVSAGKLRVFYQSELGFEPRRFSDIEAQTGELATADLDGDGYFDLYVLGNAGRATIYWGGPEGLSADRSTVVQAEAPAAPSGDGDAGVPETEAVQPISPHAAVVGLAGTPHLFLPSRDTVRLIPVRADRTLGEPVTLACARALAAAVADVNGDGHADLVFACRTLSDGQECSWVYWGGPEGFADDRRTALPSRDACDVAAGDLTGNGCADIALCQDRTADSFTYHSLVYRATPEGIDPDPVRLESHDARRVFIARTTPSERPQVILVNHRARRSGGDVDPVIYFNGGPEGFSPERSRRLKGRDAVDAVCCDLSDNGYPDIVTANCSENAVSLDPGSFVFPGKPEGYDYEPAVAFPTSRAHGVCCGDLNHDGYLDLVFVGFNNPDLLIFYGGPEGHDLEHPQVIRMEIDGVVYKEPRWVYLADLNNDGWLDLFVPQIVGDRSFILWNGPEGFSLERRQMLSVLSAACAQAADLTGNGYLDLVVGGHTPSLQGPHDSFIYIYWNGPDGLREDRRTQLPALGVEALAIADFNRDGHFDIFAANYHDGRVRDIDSFIYWGGEGGRFSAERRTRLFMHSAAGAVAADFNDDGWIDLAVGHHKVGNDHLGHSTVWWNGPDGFSPDRTTQVPSEGPHGMTRVGTANQANGGSEEFYTSAPCAIPEGTVPDRIDWEAVVPGRTWVRAQLRAAGSEAELESASWQGPEGEESWYERGGTIGAAVEGARWVQYRLALGAPYGAGTPRVSEVRVSWRTS